MCVAGLFAQTDSLPDSLRIAPYIVIYSGDTSAQNFSDLKRDVIAPLEKKYHRFDVRFVPASPESLQTGAALMFAIRGKEAKGSAITFQHIDTMIRTAIVSDNPKRAGIAARNKPGSSGLLLLFFIVMPAVAIWYVMRKRMNKISGQS